MTYFSLLASFARQGAPSLVHSGGAVGALDLLSAGRDEVFVVDMSEGIAAVADAVETILSIDERAMHVAANALSQSRSWSEGANADELIQIVQAAVAMQPGCHNSRLQLDTSN